jgi:hypothetical protein
MAVFREATTEQLILLCIVFLFGHSYRALLADPDSACDGDLERRLFFTHYFLFCAALCAVMLLFRVRMTVNAAEADSLAPGADAVARAAARLKGIASIADGSRRALRATLLVAVGLSAASACLAVATFEDGYRYRRGCPAGVGGSRSPMAVVLMVFMALLHGYFAWVAVWKD